MTLFVYHAYRYFKSWKMLQNDSVNYADIQYFISIVMFCIMKIGNMHIHLFRYNEP